MNALFSQRGGIVLIILCCLASALPVIVFPYFPSQDGGAHSYSAWALANLHEGKGLFSGYFRATHPLTNWASGALFDGLRHVTTPRGLERGFALTYIVLMAAAAIATTRYLLKIDIALAVLFFPLIFSHMLHMGSFNIALADVAFIPFIGICHRYLLQPRPALAVWIGLVLLAIFALHVQIVLVALLYTAVCVLWLGYNALRRRAENIYRIRHATWLILASIPANGLCLIFALQSNSMENHPRYIGLLGKFIHLGRLSGIAFYSLFDLAVSFLLCFALVAAGILILLRLRRETGRVACARNCMLAGAIAILLVFLAAPDGFNDAFNAEERIMIPLLIVGVSWLALGLDKLKLTRKAALIVTAFVVLQTGGRIHAFAVMNKDLAEFSEVSAAIPDGAAVISVNMERAVNYHLHYSIRRPFETLTQFDPERNFLGNVLAGREVIYASAYEAADDKPYFALKYQPWLAGVIGDRVPEFLAEQEGEKHEFTQMIDQIRQAPHPIEYLAIWQGNITPSQQELLAPFLDILYRNYREVFTSSNGRMKLYALK